MGFRRSHASQTQVNTVLPYYQSFFLYFPELKHLARADLQAILKAWEGLGYYARARNLLRAAKIVFEKYGGKIPENRCDFKGLPGVGDYIADAVMSIAFRQPYSSGGRQSKACMPRLLQT